MRDLLLIAGAGAAGALCRYAASGIAYRVLGERLPFGTLLVNLLGCLLVGVIMELGMATSALPRDLRFALTVGFLGSFTTFSTFGYETLRLAEDGAWLLAAVNVAANLGLGLAAVWLGFTTARLMMGGS